MHIYANHKWVNQDYINFLGDIYSGSLLFALLKISVEETSSDLYEFSLFPVSFYRNLHWHNFSVIKIVLLQGKF